jgi:hypothetical protein
MGIKKGEESKPRRIPKEEIDQEPLWDNIQSKILEQDHRKGKFDYYGFRKYKDKMSLTFPDNAFYKRVLGNKNRVLVDFDSVEDLEQFLMKYKIAIPKPRRKKNPDVEHKVVLPEMYYSKEANLWIPKDFQMEQNGKLDVKGDEKNSKKGKRQAQYRLLVEQLKIKSPFSFEQVISYYQGICKILETNGKVDFASGCIRNHKWLLNSVHIEWLKEDYKVSVKWNPETEKLRGFTKVSLTRTQNLF